MHGLGNDFCIINAIEQKVKLDTNNIRHLADRHLGIGFDQLLLIREKENNNFTIEIFNADGSSAWQCGNGLRCIASYLYENKLTTSKNLVLTVSANSYPVYIHAANNIEVDMGRATILNSQLNPILNDEAIHTKIIHNEQTIEAILVATGNYHAVIAVTDIYNGNTTKLAKLLASKLPFVDGCNLCFAEIINSGHIKLRVFERGVGETLACGSGACATVAALKATGSLISKVQVDFKHGSLTVISSYLQNRVKMIGSANLVFTGSINL